MYNIFKINNSYHIISSNELFKNLLKKILIFKMYYRVEMFYNNDTKITNNDVLKYVYQKNLDRYSANYIYVLFKILIIF
jgi:hypothetical protein